jgi:hypothetical protein
MYRVVCACWKYGAYRYSVVLECDNRYGQPQVLGNVVETAQVSIEAVGTHSRDYELVEGSVTYYGAAMR